MLACWENSRSFRDRLRLAFSSAAADGAALAPRNMQTGVRCTVGRDRVLDSGDDDEACRAAGGGKANLGTEEEGRAEEGELDAEDS